MITNLLRVYHDNMAHCGFEKTFQDFSANYWFPAMRKKVQEYLDNCLVCLLANVSPNVKEGEMQLVESSTIPFQTLHVDHFGPIIETKKEFKHILVVIDSFTRYTWLFAVKSVSFKETIARLADLFNIFGNPKIIVSDRGTAFSSQEFKDFLT